uniref:Exonuclease 3'-5' domain containing 2 n=1 Tax=Eptatretus burgeri TaxID=7764 RepID=A0A8C4QW68_EPTBU
MWGVLSVPRLPLFITTLSAVAGLLYLWNFIRSRRKNQAVQNFKVSLAVPCVEIQTVKPGEEFTQDLKLHSTVGAMKFLKTSAVLVNSVKDWEIALVKLHQELDASQQRVLGIDCEWVSHNGWTSPVSLLQLAGPRGFCVIVRLPHIKNDLVQSNDGTPSDNLPLDMKPDSELAVRSSLPTSLCNLLGDDMVLKTGVGVWEDAARLERDYGLLVAGCVDLRHVAVRRRPQISGEGLKSLAQDELGIVLDKDLALRCSNWDAPELSPEQESFVSWASVLTRCVGLVDVPYRGFAEPIFQSLSQCRGRTTTGSIAVNHKDGKVRRKQPGCGYALRKSPLYDNCLLRAPDGQPLSTCDKKKAQWYLDKDIAEVVLEEPLEVRLKFEPQRRPNCEDEGYYLVRKENVCVVCGKDHSYIRKNVIPLEYRRCFPLPLKNHKSHDVVLLCTCCHALANHHDLKFKQTLALECNVSITGEVSKRLLEDPERRAVRSAARALLLPAGRLPAERQHELSMVVCQYHRLPHGSEPGQELLKETASMEIR